MAILYIRNEKYEDLCIFFETFINSNDWRLRNNKNRERDTNILKLYFLGHKTKEIADKYSLSNDRIKEILERLCFYYNRYQQNKDYLN